MIKKLFVGTFGVALNVIIYILVILLAIRVITWSYDFAYEAVSYTHLTLPTT